MKQILSLLGESESDPGKILNLKLLVLQEYDAEIIRFLKNFHAKNIKYISLESRALAIHEDFFTPELEQSLREKLYLYCPECKKYFLSNENLKFEHDH